MSSPGLGPAWGPLSQAGTAESPAHHQCGTAGHASAQHWACDVPGSVLGAREAAVTWIHSAVMEPWLRRYYHVEGPGLGWVPKVLWAQRSSASLEGTV